MVERISWWHTAFGDVGWREREAINQAANELDILRHAEIANADQLQRLFQLDRAQGEEIERLRLTVRILTELLLEAGAVDPQKLQERMQAALQAHEEAKRPKQVPPPPKDHTGQPKPKNYMSSAQPQPERIVRCAQCSDEMPQSDSNFTEWGLICDDCYYRMQDT